MVYCQINNILKLKCLPSIKGHVFKEVTKKICLLLYIGRRNLVKTQKFNFRRRFIKSIYFLTLNGITIIFIKYNND